MADLQLDGVHEGSLSTPFNLWCSCGSVAVALAVVYTDPCETIHIVHRSLNSILPLRHVLLVGPA